MRVLVCGGRDYSDFDRVVKILDYVVLLAGSKTDLSICQGGAAGADDLARQWSRLRAVRCTEYPADWKLHGRSAGPIRNCWMLNDFQPDLVLAFPGGRGTQNMCDQARKAGVQVMEVAAS